MCNKAISKQIPDCFIRDVCRATTAAPTYFAPYYYTSITDEGERIEFNLVDGGVAANNPVKPLMHIQYTFPIFCICYKFQVASKCSLISVQGIT